MLRNLLVELFRRTLREGRAYRGTMRSAGLYMAEKVVISLANAHLMQQTKERDGCALDSG